MRVRERERERAWHIEEEAEQAATGTLTYKQESVPVMKLMPQLQKLRFRSALGIASVWMGFRVDRVGVRV